MALRVLLGLKVRTESQVLPVLEEIQAPPGRKETREVLELQEPPGRRVPMELPVPLVLLDLKDHLELPARLEPMV